MDRQTRTQQTLHLHCSGHFNRGPGSHVNRYHTHDIFPDIDIPVVTVIWSYSGLSAKEMEQRVTTFSEFVYGTVNDIKAIDSQTVNGAAVIKISFQPQVRIDAAMSQIGAAVNSIRFRCRPA